MLAVLAMDHAPAPEFLAMTHPGHAAPAVDAAMDVHYLTWLGWLVGGAFLLVAVRTVIQLLRTPPAGRAIVIVGACSSALMSAGIAAMAIARP